MTRNKTKIDEMKIEALRLHKMIKQSIKLSFNQASLCTRLQRLPQFASLSSEMAYEKFVHITFDDCLDLIALENGEKNWNNLVKKYSTAITFLSDEDLIYLKEVSDGILNAWFSSYSEAKKYQLQHKNNYLFQYKNTFFVCSAAYIESLGMDVHDPDWELIGRDWVKPSCIEAQARLRNKLIQSRLKITKRERIS